MFELTYKEDESPVLQVLPLADDVSREGGGQEPHGVRQTVGDPQQGAREVRGHVDMGAHEP